METHGTLKKYFEPEHVGDALEAYERYAVRSKAWWVDRKLELYRFADIAFDFGIARSERFAAFEKIYGRLNGEWKVFRRATTYWSAEQIYSVLEEHGTKCSKSSPIDLLVAARNDHIECIVDLVYHVKDLKILSDGRSVPMAISKFLHFFNPRLFPIYDTAVVGEQVLRTFAADWYGCEKRYAIGNIHFPTAYYVQYVCWLGDFMLPHAPQIMARFNDWLRAHVASLGKGVELSGNLEDYYATAAEFIAIGAMASVTEA